MLVLPREAFERLFNGEEAGSHVFLDVIHRDLTAALRQALRPHADWPPASQALSRRAAAGGRSDLGDVEDRRGEVPDRTGRRREARGDPSDARTAPPVGMPILR